MDFRSLQLCCIAAASLILPFHSFAACSISKLADLPVRMVGLRALMPVRFNGIDAQLVVDSGMFYSMLSPAGAAALSLKTRPTTVLSYIEGVNWFRQRLTGNGAGLCPR
jgi:hypothetical protein